MHVPFETNNYRPACDWRVCCFLRFVYASIPYSWVGQSASDYLWTSPANWNTGVPGGNQVAVFSDSAATQPTVDLGNGGNITVQGLTFNGNLNNIQITAINPSAPSLILNGGTADAAVTINGGQETISATIVVWQRRHGYHDESER